MTSLLRRVPAFLVFFAPFFLHPIAANSQTPASPQAASSRDGMHDFDFEDGTWKIHLKRLQHPLTGSHTWTEFDGTTTTRKLWNGGAHIEEFETEGSSGHVEGLTLRIYDQEPYNGRMIFVRFLWSGITSNSAHFEQSFSDDGGKTWEVNWITDQTRVSEVR